MEAAATLVVKEDAAIFAGLNTIFPLVPLKLPVTLRLKFLMVNFTDDPLSTGKKNCRQPLTNQREG